MRMRSSRLPLPLQVVRRRYLLALEGALGRSSPALSALKITVEYALSHASVSIA